MNHVLGVSDGVGGAFGGEIASRYSIKTVEQELRNKLGSALVSTLAETAMLIDKNLRDQATAQPKLAGMAATLSVVWLRGGRVGWVHVGDSRIYMLRNTQLIQLSIDHSPVGKLRASGIISEAEARAHRFRNLIDQAVGSAEKPIEPATGEIAVYPQDVFLVCSDGLYDGLWETEIKDILMDFASMGSASNVALQLVNLSVARSGRDNTTAAVARVVA
jgi:protein phosphatase